MKQRSSVRTLAPARCASVAIGASSPGAPVTRSANRPDGNVFGAMQYDTRAE